MSEHKFEVGDEVFNEGIIYIIEKIEESPLFKHRYILIRRKTRNSDWVNPSMLKLIKKHKPELKVGDEVRYYNGINIIEEINPDKEQSILIRRNDTCYWVDAEEITLVKEDKPEFKVDKLGWYKAVNNKRIKIVHKSVKMELLGVFEFDDTYVCKWKINGEYDIPHRSCNYNENDLIEYIAPELHKEPRKFEFETTTAKNNFSINIKIGQNCIVLPESYQGINTTKWHVTMEEILK